MADNSGQRWIVEFYKKSTRFWAQMSQIQDSSGLFCFFRPQYVSKSLHICWDTLNYYNEQTLACEQLYVVLSLCIVAHCKNWSTVNDFSNNPVRKLAILCIDVIFMNPLSFLQNDKYISSKITFPPYWALRAKLII